MLRCMLQQINMKKEFVLGKKKKKDEANYCTLMNIYSILQLMNNQHGSDALAKSHICVRNP